MDEVPCPKNAAATSARPAFVHLLNYLGNHEIKLILALLLANRPHESLGSGQLRGEFIAVQGTRPAWVPHPTGGPLVRYVELSIARCGAACLVAQETGRWDTAWRCHGNPDLAPRVLAFAGAVLGWSLEHPDISVQQILGRQMHGRVSPPEVRHEIYTQLLRDSAGGTSMASMFHRFAVPGYQWTDLTHQMDRLARLGIVHIASNKMLHNNPTFTLEAGTRHFAAKGAKPGITAEEYVLYRALDSMVRDTPASYTVQDFIEACRSVHVDQPYDLPRVRRLLLQNRPLNSRVGLRFDNTDYDPAHYTTVAMTQQYVQPITDLCSRLAWLADPPLAARYRRQAKDIITNPDAVNRLVVKGRRFSTVVQRRDQPQQLPAKLLDIIRESGSVTVRQATTLAATDGRVWDTETVSYTLRRMAAAGQLETSMARPEPGKKRARLPEQADKR